MNNNSVELLDYFGDDLMVVNAARVSYDKFKNKFENNDKKLINYLVKHKHCYDEQTEVLTSTGFVPWPLINESSELATVCPKTRSFKGFERPSALVSSKVNENLIHFKTKDIDLLVTKGHSLYCSFSSTIDKRASPIFTLTPGNSLCKKHKEAYSRPMRMIKCCKNTKDSNPDPIYKLYGFFIGDGCADSTNRISFHIKKKRKVEYLYKICQENNLRINKLQNDTYSIVSNMIGNTFREMFYNNNKKTFPNSFFNMSKKEYLFFKSGLINSDGSVKRTTYVYSTSSNILKDKIQSLASINDDVVSISESNNGYVLNFCSRRKSPRLNDNKNNKYKEVPYNGTVYCATVSTGLLVVRRNNKIVLSGNSSPFRHPQLQFRIECPIFVERQLFKHQVGLTSNCLASDANIKLMNDDGSIFQITIKELYWKLESVKIYLLNKQLRKKILTLDETTNKFTFGHIINVFKSGIKDIYEIKTENGNTLRCSPDHRIWTNEGWKTINSGLSVGMKIGTHTDKKNQTNKLCFSEVVEIKYIDKQETFDIEVDGPNHNFVANNVVVHNSISGRYVDFSDSYSLPTELRLQSKDSKQGSEGTLENPVELLNKIENLVGQCSELYEELCKNGVAKEQARIILPLCLNTKFIWTGSLAAFLHLFSLRIKPDAQQETREVALEMLKQIKNIPGEPFKYTLEAFGF